MVIGTDQPYRRGRKGRVVGVGYVVPLHNLVIQPLVYQPVAFVLGGGDAPVQHPLGAELVVPHEVEGVFQPVHLADEGLQNILRLLLRFLRAGERAVFRQAEAQLRLQWKQRSDGQHIPGYRLAEGADDDAAAVIFGAFHQSLII